MIIFEHKSVKEEIATETFSAAVWCVNVNRIEDAWKRWESLDDDLSDAILEEGTFVDTDERYDLCMY